MKYIVFMLTLLANCAYGQAKLFVGPSSQINFYSAGVENGSILFPSIGFVMGLEKGVMKKHIWANSLNTHLSTHKNRHWINNEKNQTDLIFDLRSELRLFLFQKKPDRFLSTGINGRYLKMYNYYADNSGYSEDPSIETELFGVVSYGSSCTIKDRNCSYLITLGFSTWEKEYPNFVQVTGVYYISKNQK